MSQTTLLHHRVRLLTAAALCLGVAIAMSRAASASGEPPVPSAGTDMTVNEDTLTWFNGTAVDPESDPMAFSWLFPGGQVVDGAEVEFALPDPGSFPVYFFANDGTSNESDSITVEVLDITAPTIVIADGPNLVADEDAAFAIDGSGSFDNVAISEFAWTVHDADTTHNYNTAAISYTWAQPGTYLVSLTAYDDADNMGTGTATVTVLDVTAPTAVFTLASAVNEDTEQELDASDSTDNVGIVSFTWTIGEWSGPLTVLGATATHTWPYPGDYDVTLSAADAAGNVGTSTLSVTVLDTTPPSPVITVASAFNEDSDQLLDGSSSVDNVGVVSWQWVVGDAGGGAALSGQTVTYNWATPGTFEIMLTVADAAGNQIAGLTTVTVRDITPPVASMTVAARFKIQTAQLLDGTLSTDNAAIDDYEWTFFDGATPVTLHGATASYTWTVPGDFVVALKVTDQAGFMDTAFFTVTALENTPPVAVIYGAATFDERTWQTFDGLTSTDNVGVVSWSWLLGDAGTTASLSGAAVEYIWTTPGVYTLTLTVADAAENTATAQMTVEVLDATAPTASFTLPASVGNVALTLDGTPSTDNVGITSWVWTLADTSGPVTLTGQTVIHTWLVPGSFLVTLVASDAAGNTGTKSLLLTVVDTTGPSASAGANQRADEDTTVTFDATATTDNDPTFPAGARFTWIFTDGAARALTGALVTWVFHTPGTFHIALEVSDAAGNLGAASTTVTVADLTAPTAALSLPFSVAEDAPFTLDGTASSDNVAVGEWVWNIVGESFAATRSGATAAFTWETPGWYTVTLTVRDAAGNSAATSASLLVRDITPPAAVAGLDLAIDEDTAAAFDARPSTDNSLDFAATGRYTWFFNDGGASQTLTGPTASHVFATPGTYAVTLLVVDGSGNFGLDLLFVTARDVTAPTAGAVGGPSQQVPEDLPVTFDASPSRDNDPLFAATGTFKWEVLGAAGMTHWGRAASHTFASPGIYAVVLTVHDLAGNAGTFEIAYTVTDTTPPVAAAALPAAVDEDTPLTLDGAPASDNVGVVAWTWTVEDLDGSHVLTGVAPTYTWDTPGLFHVTLAVGDAAGHLAQTSSTILVADTTAPTGVPTYDAAIDEGGRASFWSITFVDNDPTFDLTRSDVWTFDEFGQWVELAGKEASHIFAKAGTFVVNLAVLDASGNAFTTSFEVLVRDTTVPWITLFSPEEGQLVSERSVVLTGHFEPGTLLYINGVAIDNLGSFAERVALVEGPNTVNFEVRDPAGNHITRTLHLTVDSTPPQVTVDAPQADAVTNAFTVRLTGHVQDASDVVLTVAGTEVPVSSGGGFIVDVPLAEGANLVQLVAVDAAGHRSVVGFSVARDTRAPTPLAAVSGAEAKGGVLATTASSVDLAGYAEAGTALTLCVPSGTGATNCTPVAVAADGSFHVPVPLAPGATTTFALRASDAAGNVATQTFEVSRAAAVVDQGVSAWVWGGGFLAVAATVGAALGLMWRRRSRPTPALTHPEAQAGQS